MNLREQYLYFIANPDSLMEEVATAGKCNENALATELRLQTGLYIHWAQLASIGRYELQKAERHFKDTLMPDLREAARARIREAGKKETVDGVDDAMKLSPVYREAAQRVDDLKFVSDLLEDAADALWERKGCLQSAKSLAGKEMEQY